MAIRRRWFIVWLGLEMNTIIFLMIGPDLTSKKTEFEIKYFITQVIGSSLFISGWAWLWEPALFLSLIIKIILFPFLFWVYECLKWIELNTLWVFLLVQKLGPIRIFFNLNIKPIFMILILNFFFSLGIGVIKRGGIDLLILSSISQISISMFLCSISWFFFLYLFIYSLIVRLAWLRVGKNKNLILQFTILIGLPPSLLFITKTHILILIRLRINFSFIVVIMFGFMTYIYMKFFMGLFFNLSQKSYSLLSTNFKDKISEIFLVILAFVVFN